MKGTTAEGDGNRNLINQKLLLSIFKSLGQYSKYAIEMFNSIAQMEVMLTSRQAEEFKWGFFTNWNGGQGKKHWRWFGPGNTQSPQQRDRLTNGCKQNNSFYKQSM